MSSSGCVFQPGIALPLIAVLLTVVFMRLGFWQLDRAEEKQHLKDTIEVRRSQPPLMPTTLLGADAELSYRTVVVRGTFDADKQVFLDNRKHHGRAGYHVITPLRIDGTDIRLLINRGWVAAGRDRAVLPDVNTPTTEIEVHGSIRMPATPALVLGTKRTLGPVWGTAWPYLDIGRFAAQAGCPLQPFVVLMDPRDAHGFLREWPDFDPKREMHIGYAIQWFAFAVMTIGVFLGLSVTRVTTDSAKQ